MTLKEEVRKWVILNLDTDSKATVIKTVWYWHSIILDTGHKSEGLEIATHRYSQVILDNCGGVRACAQIQRL